MDVFIYTLEFFGRNIYSFGERYRTDQTNKKDFEASILIDSVTEEQNKRNIIAREGYRTNRNTVVQIFDLCCTDTNTETA